MPRGKNLMLYLALLICGGVLATVSGGDARSQNSVEASKERPNTDKAAAKIHGRLRLRVRQARMETSQGNHAQPRASVQHG